MRKIFLSTFLTVLVIALLPFFAAAGSSPVHYPVFRLYNASLADHLYTASSEEATKVQTQGYVLEGNLGNVAVRDLTVSQTPFYRLYNKRTHRHFYTDSNDELAAAVVSGGYILEGTLGYLADPRYPTYEGAVFHLHNPASGDHLYTSDWVEWGMLQISGWRDEGMLRGKLF